MMKKLFRPAASLLALGSGVALVLGLAALGSEAQGPIAYTLGQLGSGVSGLESKLVRHVRGPGRAGELAWFAGRRSELERLREPDEVLLGAFDGAMPKTLDGVLALERALGTTLPLIHLYAAWGDRPDQQFPRRQVQAVWELGSVPVVTWEPWLVDFENRLHPHLPLRQHRDKGGLASIARGEYDFYIDRWALDAAKWGRPLLVRLGHEMNDPYRYPWGPQNNRPDEFVAAWRHVVERFREAGATNVLWVWSPHVAYEGYEGYYPGADVVDWVATGVLNYGTVAHWSRWWTFDDIFGQHHEPLAGFGKPIMIAELGSLVVGGDRDAWLQDALNDLPSRYPAVRALLFFHVERDATVTYQALDWSFERDPSTLAAVRAALGSWSDRIAHTD
jgi:hypothetical protein